MAEAINPNANSRQWFVAFAVLMASILTAFDIRTAGIGLSDLRGAFGLTFDEGAWLSTFATAPQALAAPCVGWLVAVFGIRRVMIGPSVLYTIISIVIPFTRDFEVLLALHAVRGVIMGMFVGGALMLAFRSLDRRLWIVALSFYVVRIPVAQNLGVYAAGSYTQTIGWQWLYWEGAVVAPVVAVLFWFGSRPSRTDPTLLDRADWGGMAIFGVALTTIYFALDQGNRLDWFKSGFVVSMFFAATSLFCVFLWHESRIKDPWAHISILVNRNVILGFSAIACFMVASLGSSLLQPNFLVTVAHLRPEQIGDFNGPYSIILLIASTATAVALVRTIKQRATLIVGFSCFALSAWLGTHLTSQWSIPEFRFIVVLQVFGEEIVFLGAVATIFTTIPPAKAISLAAYIQIMRLICSETVVTSMATWVRQREQLHSFLIGLHVTGSTPGFSSIVTILGSRGAVGITSSEATQRGLGVLSSMIRREAYVLAYIDGFWITFIAAVAGLVIVSLMAPPPAHPLTTRAV